MVNFLALITAISIAAVAAYYSIVGLIAIFAAAAVPIAVMGSVLEVGKLVTASWLYQNWNNVSVLLKTYLTAAVVILMFITSMGIFGYLSKAHIDQGVDSKSASLVIETLESKIESEQTKIKRLEKTIQTLDLQIDRFVELGAVTKSLNALEDQKEDRERIQSQISSHEDTIAEFNAQISEAAFTKKSYEVEMGPLIYISELLYGSSDREVIEEAVRFVILIIIFVFDPLAVLLLVAANHGIATSKKSLPVEEKSSTINTIELPEDEDLGPNFMEKFEQSVDKSYKAMKKKILPANKVEVDKSNIAKF